MRQYDAITCIEAKRKSLTRYYTGRPCKYGHVAERLTTNRTCVICHSAKTIARCKERYHADENYRKRVIAKKVKARRERYQADAGFREHIKKLNKKYYSINPEKFHAATKKWIQKNPERRKEYSRKWAKKSYDANPDKYRKRTRCWRENNLEAAKAKLRSWQKNNPAAVNAHNGKRRAMRLHATPKWADDKKMKAIYEKARRLGMHVDHILPLNSDFICGLHVHGNLQLLTPSQNISKGNKITAEAMCVY